MLQQIAENQIPSVASVKLIVATMAHEHPNDGSLDVSTISVNQDYSEETEHICCRNDIFM